jgi:peptide/nickel transport system substrate-binding protein
LTFCGTQENDPQINGVSSTTYEILRCCLLRSLLSYNGQSTSGGGTLLRPDVATRLPSVSADGLTWTFQLRRGLRYAPPLQEMEITAGDFVRSIERLLGPPQSDLPPEYGTIIDSYLGDFLALKDIVAGAKAYVDGDAERISGLETPDAHTLVIHLTKPDGSLGYLFSLPDTAPIPANPFAPTARFGVAEGHGRFYTRFLVASGPYMLEGAPELDFSLPPDQQIPVSGDAPNRMTLVRNPSWDRSTDQLRKALVDRIELTPVPSPEEGLRLVKSGGLDLVLDQEATLDVLGPDAAGPGTRAYTTSRDAIYYVGMNLAIPPLDDVHVRKALNFAIGRNALLPSFEKAGTAAAPITHVGLDSEENNLLLNFDPFGASTGNLAAAKEEMAQSRYDSDHDGTCDASVCRGIQVVVRKDFGGVAGAARQMAKQVAPLGVQLDVHAQDGDTFNSTYRDPEAHVAMRVDEWIKDLVSGGTYFPFLFGGPEVGAGDYGEGLLGASPAQLRRWGYQVASVPNVDERINACLPLTFGAQVRCWADLDQYLMTEVVPWIPLVGLVSGRVVSDRVARFSFDQAWGFPVPALDQLAVRPGSTPGPAPHPSLSVPAIPAGRYRVTITKSDLHRFDPHYDPGGIQENTGTVTITLRPDGWFESWATADHPLYFPLGVGTYTGSADSVTFTTVAPVLNALATPPMHWSFDGKALHLTFLGCGNLNELDPGAPHLCDDIRVLYEAHPWVKVD